MKHEKEWYTCDRCGEIIKVPPNGCITHKIPMSAKEYEVITHDESGYIAGAEFNNIGTLTVEIIQYYDTKNKSIHLCRKCQKAFERFIKK